MLRSLLAPLRNLQDHGDGATLNDDAQCTVLVPTIEESALESQVKSLVEDLKMAQDTQSRITVKTNVAQ